MKKSGRKFPNFYLQITKKNQIRTSEVVHLIWWMVSCNFLAGVTFSSFLCSYKKWFSEWKTHSLTELQHYHIFFDFHLLFEEKACDNMSYEILHFLSVKFLLYFFLEYIHWWWKLVCNQIKNEDHKTQKNLGSDLMTIY